ncbi:cytochrome o ubiquinol oxidase subunit II [Wigglesworthia glossinidia endosymbiont of Glossina morsitans morsitans (Yale colony)]|uniref:Ubiquinol oxidase subunit 2 n=1 Tax=Wigglesworthia glossinidia endosymbiont of Glossina morsitans morsitans (Yale colony) TaxID=1142511 RepID=H6Q5G6_WIGGL|nr:ubiquinol oxidase subunit II [Wigglesworthia glossinidia]AFA41449.1 cytochrome o ubiquinol oxidase subunit II [Wigglesworthia glossinidia endosymbiont of Glossina morsitans morsitans (Yale colony)]
MIKNNIKKLKNTILVCILFFLNSCKNITLMNPQGLIGLEEKKLILIAIFLMLGIVLPVIIMTIVFVFKYRESNTRSIYLPNWQHSKKIEYIIWGVPIFAIIFLATITWNSTHSLDPKKEIQSLNSTLNIQVISLDWKWLFIYPDYNIATVNEIAFPKNVPIKFNITSSSVMNSFFIPQLGGQIYAMAGMNSILHLVSNETGKYKGISANFSGPGFSEMKFIAISLSDKNEFDTWIKNIQKSSKKLENMQEYQILAHPSINHPIEHFSRVKPNLFDDVVNQFKHSHNIYN